MIWRWIVVVSLAAAALMGQTTGALEGTVHDPSGAVVPGALVRILETGTAAERPAETDSTGRFLAPQLAPGTYDVVVSHTGFRDEVQKAIRVEAGSTARVGFRLELGESRDQVVVSAETALVDASPAGSASSVREQQLENLPVVGRDVFELAAQQPGVLLLRNADQSVTRGMGMKYSVHGVRPTQNGFLLDGIPISDSAGSVEAGAAGLTLGLESMREVVIVASPFSAEYGQSVGAVFAAVTKSGGNQLHGSAYEYFRNDALDARNFFDDPADPAPPFRRNQFGGLVSGPISRNRVYFLANFEGVRETLSTTLRSVAPNADAHQGRLPAAGGGVKTVTVAPAVRPYLDLYPLPNGQDFGDGTGEYVEQSVRRTREDYAAGKLDALLSPSLRLAGRFGFDDARQSQPQPLAIWSYYTITRNRFASAEMQQVISARTVHTLRAAFSRVPAAELADLLVDVPASMSFMPNQPLGVISVTGLADIGPNTVRQRPRRHTLNTYQANDDLVHVRGRHTFKAGAGLDRIQFNQVADFSASGYYQFGSLPDFLKGAARTGDAMVPGSDTQRAWRQTRGFAFFQHEMKLRPDLSVSYGIRYESAGTPSEIHGKVASLRDYLSDTEVTVGGAPYRNPSGNTFAPRASVAWDPAGSGRMVVRAGGGIFYDLLGVRDLIVAGGRVPPFYNRASLTKPAFPNLAGAVASAKPLNALDTIDYNLQQPYVAQVQVSVERQLAGGLLVSAGYAGSRGIHLLSFVGNVNATAPRYLPDGSVYLPPNAARLNPAFSQIAMRRSQFDSVYHGLIVAIQRRWRSGLGFQGSYQWSKSIDDSSSTIANDFDSTDSVPTVYNYRANRGLSDFDLRHVAALNLSWRVPSPSGGSTALARIWRGWELHALAKVQSGEPFAPTVGFDRVGLQSTRADLGQRPDFLGVPGQRIILGDPEKYFDPTVFGLPAAGYFGTLGRGTLIGPGLFALDAAMQKTLWQREQQSLRFRFEAFNITNHPNFRQPSNLALFDSTSARVGSAGMITQTSTPSRQIQLALRWAF